MKLKTLYLDHIRSTLDIKNKDNIKPILTLYACFIKITQERN